MLPYKECYGDKISQIKYKGRHVTDCAQFISYLSTAVVDRLTDSVEHGNFESDLRAVATTGMATENLARLLSSQDKDRESWEVGEAMAECLLEEEFGIKWPWNTERDKRTPRASLPGADLIGFYEESGETTILVGEVKTSSDENTPPTVMNGKSGMIHQIDKLCSNTQIHSCIFNWLYFRCRNTEYWPLFQRSVIKYLETNGQAITLFGFLMRDTQPNILDIKNRAEKLVNNIKSPMTLDLQVWYLPTPSKNWWPAIKGKTS